MLANPSNHYQLVQNAIAWLELEQKALHEGQRTREPDLDEIGRMLGLSPCHVQRVFLEWAGISPKRFFQVLQRRHAVSLLKQGLTTLQSSIALGMGSTSQLHNLILKLEAMTPGQVQQRGQGITFKVGAATTPLGTAFVCQTEQGLHNLEFETPTLGFEEWLAGLRMQYPLGQFDTALTRTQQLVDHIFKGGMRQPLHLQLRASAFQLQVWEALMHLPPGQFTSYQQLAQAIGKPKASRAVGSAVASNPVAYLIPCHRVIQSTGQLGQYRWTQERKMLLHAWEIGQRETQPLTASKAQN
ncbi:MAG TPA: methylated-DNA--[protein]-cysteine S-methyltransferase [Limnobacter sp.]|nr:methylated-DNA--[protein]-cysteine S-methyltransferase [Limnobacter sp.]